MARVITCVVDDGETNLTVEVGGRRAPFGLKSAAGTRRHQPRAFMNGETFLLVVLVVNSVKDPPENWRRFAEKSVRSLLLSH